MGPKRKQADAGKKTDKKSKQAPLPSIVYRCECESDVHNVDSAMRCNFIRYSIVGRYRQSERIVIGTYSTKAKVVQNSKMALDALSP